jgi:hypothetical protein
MPSACTRAPRSASSPSTEGTRLNGWSPVGRGTIDRVRPMTTLALAVLLVAILVAATIQLLVIATK